MYVVELCMREVWVVWVEPVADFSGRSKWLRHCKLGIVSSSLDFRNSTNDINVCFMRGL
jgi:hypothetical protein